jgi:hypothetical protein
VQLLVAGLAFHALAVIAPQHARLAAQQHRHADDDEHEQNALHDGLAVVEAVVEVLVVLAVDERLVRIAAARERREKHVDHDVHQLGQVLGVGAHRDPLVDDDNAR